MSSASGKAATARSTLSSRSRCSVGYGERFVAFVMSSMSVPANWNCGWKLAICSTPSRLSSASASSATPRKSLKSMKSPIAWGCTMSVVSTDSGSAAARCCSSCTSSSSSAIGSVVSDSTQRIWPLLCTALAKGQRFRPMTAFSSQRVVSSRAHMAGEHKVQALPRHGPHRPSGRPVSPADFGTRSQARWAVPSTEAAPYSRPARRCAGVSPGRRYSCVHIQVARSVLMLHRDAED